TVGSTTKHIYVQATQRDATQLAADTSPPLLSELLAAAGQSAAGQSATGPTNQKAFDGAIQIHESLIDNVATRILAGRTVTGKQIDELLAFSNKPLLGGIATAQESFEIDF